VNKKVVNHFEFYEFVGQELHGPAGAIVGRCATSPSDQCGFGFPIELALGTRTRAFAQGSVQALFDKALADAFDGGAPDMEGHGNRIISLTCIGLEQDVGA
jgi:hypothetical protein